MSWHDDCPRCPVCDEHRHGGSCAPGMSEHDLGDQLAVFADEIAEWAELSLQASFENWPDDAWNE